MPRHDGTDKYFNDFTELFERPLADIDAHLEGGEIPILSLSDMLGNRPVHLGGTADTEIYEIVTKTTSALRCIGSLRRNCTGTMRN